MSYDIILMSYDIKVTEPLGINVALLHCSNSGLAYFHKLPLSPFPTANSQLGQLGPTCGSDWANLSRTLKILFTHKRMVYMLLHSPEVQIYFKCIWELGLKCL